MPLYNLVLNIIRSYLTILRPDCPYKSKSLTKLANPRGAGTLAEVLRQTEISIKDHKRLDPSSIHLLQCSGESNSKLSDYARLEMQVLSRQTQALICNCFGPRRWEANSCK